MLTQLGKAFRGGTAPAAEASCAPGLPSSPKPDSMRPWSPDTPSRPQLKYLWGQGRLAGQLCHRSVPANTEHRGQNSNCILFPVSIPAPGLSLPLEAAMGWSRTAKPVTLGSVLVGFSGGRMSPSLSALPLNDRFSAWW